VLAACGWVPACAGNDSSWRFLSFRHSRAGGNLVLAACGLGFPLAGMTTHGVSIVRIRAGGNLVLAACGLGSRLRGNDSSWRFLSFVIPARRESSARGGAVLGSRLRGIQRVAFCYDGESRTSVLLRNAQIFSRRYDAIDVVGYQRKSEDTSAFIFSKPVATVDSDGRKIPYRRGIRLAPIGNNGMLADRLDYVQTRNDYPVDCCCSLGPGRLSKAPRLVRSESGSPRDMCRTAMDLGCVAPCNVDYQPEVPSKMDSRKTKRSRQPWPIARPFKRPSPNWVWLARCRTVKALANPQALIYFRSPANKASTRLRADRTYLLRPYR